MKCTRNTLVRKTTFDYAKILARQNRRSESLAVPINFNLLVQHFADANKLDVNNPSQLDNMRKKLTLIHKRIGKTVKMPKMLSHPRKLDKKSTVTFGDALKP